MAITEMQMADAKGTYFGPGERGLATILPTGPNFAGRVQSLAATNARRAAMLQSAKDKAEARRAGQVSKVYDAFSKPIVSPQLYQEKVNVMRDEYLAKLQEMDLSGADSSTMRAFAATAVNDMKTYAESAKQLVDAIDKVNKLNTGSKYKVFKTDDIRYALTDKLVDKDGELIDPRKIDQEDLSVDRLIFESGEGLKYVDEKAIVDQFTNSEDLKATAVDIETKIAEQRKNGMIKYGTETSQFTGKPFHDIDPVTGKVVIKDARGLTENGVYQLALNDRFMALLLKNKADETLMPGEEAPMGDIKFSGTEMASIAPTDAEVDMAMSENLVELLQGRVGGATLRKRIDEHYKNLPGAGKSAKAPTKAQEEYLSEEKFTNDLRSGSPDLVTKAVKWVTTGKHAHEILPEGELKPSETIIRVEGTADGLIFKIGEETQSGNLKKGGDGQPLVRYYSIPISELDEEVIRTIHSYTASDVKRNYKTSERGEDVETPKPAAPKKIFSISDKYK